LAPLQALQRRLHLQPKRLPLQLCTLKLPQRWHLRQSQRLQLGLQNSMLQLQLLAVVVALQELSDCQWGRLRWDLLLMWFLRCSWLLRNCSGRRLGSCPGSSPTASILAIKFAVTSAAVILRAAGLVWQQPLLFCSTFLMAPLCSTHSQRLKVPLGLCDHQYGK
jgi:hypothetical protein